MKIKGEEIKINRETAKVSEWDKVYCNLLQEIIDNNEITSNRTGTDTLSIPGATFKLDLQKEFPILESKKVAIYNALSEILWIHQAQRNDVKWLHDRGNTIWDQWIVDDDGIYRIYEKNNPDEYDKNKEVTVLGYTGKELKIKAKSKIPGLNIKAAVYYGKNYAGTIGTAYGWINSLFKKPQYVLNNLINNPTDRRMNIILWQDKYIKTGTLPPCVWSSEWKVSSGKLHCFVHQRSADCPVGLPFNVAQYAILQYMFAKVSNLEPGTLNWSIMDAHIYVDQLKEVKLQLLRFKLMQEYEDFIKNNTDLEIEKHYYNLISKQLILSVNEEKDKELDEKIRVLEYMLTKTKPEFELKERNNFFEYDNNIDNNKEYLKQNATGNDEIRLIKYKSLPFIKMTVTQ